MSPTTRPYRPADRNACLELFDGNTPDFFLPHERSGFERYLDLPGDYLVIEDAGQVVACGGVLQEGDRAGLVWGMVARQHHRRGLGSALLFARLARLRETGAENVELDTTPHSAPFFERHGFQRTRHTVNGYGDGLDRVDMVLHLKRRAQ